MSQAAGFDEPSLTLRTDFGYSGTTIYANGNMQAKLVVTYENIPSDYTVDNIEIKQAYTYSNLPNTWEVSSFDNGFDSNINAQTRSMPNHNTGSPTNSLFYLSTKNSGADITVCVELTASSPQGDKETLSTCDGGTNNGLVGITVVPELNYGVADLNRSGSRAWYDNYAIANERFTLINGRQIRDVGGCSDDKQNNGQRYLISSTNGPAHPDSGNHKFSAVYLFKPNNGVVNSHFRYSTGYVWKDTTSLSFNTTNAITLAVLHGQDNLKTYVNPLINWAIHCPNITFQDNYGNEGNLSLSRTNGGPNDRWGNVYYDFH
ncbi:hypothetical protein [Moritella sp. JT01]|uniref:hypothetical protein n=1 Tax=Moritella sp. JT01 TaxID=756698 RepID=UPI0012FAC5CB|nr:hypothetical protein [Moritella sp. JT01]